MSIQKRNIESSRIRTEIFRNAQLKECILNNTKEKCLEGIINAHSLQRMGSLSILEGEVNGNQQLYAITEKHYNPDTGKIELKPIGKKKASTFFGFCGSHDRQIFEPLEQDPELINLDSDEHCFLLSFRAFSISYHRKKEYVNLLSKKDEGLRSKIRKYFNHDDIEGHLEGAKLGLFDMEPQKIKLTNTLYSGDYSCLDFFTYELSYTSPVAMCMLTSPPYLFSGKAINVGVNSEYQYSDILTTVAPLKSRTLIILAAFKSDPYGSEYLDELNEMDDTSLQKALTWHILTTAENCFFSPQWYDRLNSWQRQYIIGLHGFVANINNPEIQYDSEKFKLNLFDNRFAIKTE